MKSYYRRQCKCPLILNLFFFFGISHTWLSIKWMCFLVNNTWKSDQAVLWIECTSDHSLSFVVAQWHAPFVFCTSSHSGSISSVAAAALAFDQVLAPAELAELIVAFQLCLLFFLFIVHEWADCEGTGDWACDYAIPAFSTAWIIQNNTMAWAFFPFCSL